MFERGVKGQKSPPMADMTVSFWYGAPPDRMPSFVRKDYQAIAQFAHVRWYPTRAGWRRGFGPTGWFPTRADLRALNESDVAVQWFADVASVVVGARVLRRPSLLIAGGYDVAAVPEIRYGRMLLRRTRWMGKLALLSASMVVCVSRANLSEVRRWAPSAEVDLLYHGFEADAFPYGAKKRRQVVTVGAVSREYFERKGLDTFARTSRLMPDVDFIVAGRIVHQDVAGRLRELGSSRLLVTDYLAQAELIRLLQESQVYAQLSIHEAFGCSVAEAMLCGCTPVVSDRGALPEVVGDCGYYVPAKNPEAAAQAVLLALGEPRGWSARERIVKEFPMERRSAGLRDHLLRLAGGRTGRAD